MKIGLTVNMSVSMFLIMFVSQLITLCELTGPENCTLKANLPCMMYTFYDQCARGQLEVRFADLYESSDTHPARADQFNADIYYDLNAPNKPGVNLTFTPPNDESIALLKGFQITRTKSNKPGSEICYIFNLSGANWTVDEDTDVVYSLPIFPIAAGVIYSYDLVTLPYPEPHHDQSRHVAVTASRYEDSGDPEHWTPVISFTVFHDNRTILTEVDLPPEHSVNVSLFNAEKETLLSNLTSDPMLQFDDVTPGVYQLWAEPMNCSTCKPTKTLNFTLRYIPLVTTSSVSTSSVSTASTSQPTTLSLEEPTATAISTNAILAPVFGTLSAIIVIGLVVVCYRYYCRPEEYNLKQRDVNPIVNVGFDPEVESVITLEMLRKGCNMEKHYNDNAKKVQFEKRAKLFILYEEDHKHHRSVVDNFATYLSVHCQCDVEQAELHLDAPWVHEDLEQAEYVIIINSEAAYKTYMSCHSKINPRNNNTAVLSINSVRNRFMRDERFDHIIMVYFSYTDERFILPDICTGYTYKLMKHFTDFLLRVHKLRRTDNLSKFDLPLDGNHNLRAIGQQLLESIDRSTRYEADNPHWYTQTTGMIRNMVNMSKASQPVSGDLGRPAESTTGNIRISHPIAPWYNVNSNGHIDTQSVITVTESDLNVGGQYAHLFPKSVSMEKPTLELQYAKQTAYEESAMVSQAIDSDSDYDFIAPDLNSNVDDASLTQSKQLECIVNHYTNVMKDL